MLSSEDLGKIEEVARRIVREELRTLRTMPGRKAPAPTTLRQSIADGGYEEGVEKVRRVLEYLKQIDPDGMLPRDESIQLTRLRFPEFNL